MAATALPVIGSLAAGKASIDAAKGAGNTKFTPFSGNTPFGKTEFSGDSFTASLNPEQQELADVFRNIALSNLKASQGVDPTAIAREQIDQFQDVVAPSRNRQRDSLLNNLFNKGIVGLADAEGANPLAKAQELAFAEQDAEQALGALDRGMNFRTDLFNTGISANTAEQNLMSQLLNQISIGGNLGTGAATIDMQNARLKSAARQTRANTISDIVSGVAESGLFDGG